MALTPGDKSLPKNRIIVKLKEKEQKEISAWNIIEGFPSYQSFLRRSPLKDVVPLCVSKTTTSDTGWEDDWLHLAVAHCSLSGIMLNGLGLRTCTDNKAASQLPCTLPTDPFRCVQNGHLANSIGSGPCVAFGLSFQWEGGNITLDTHTRAHMQTRTHTHTHIYTYTPHTQQTVQTQTHTDLQSSSKHLIKVVLMSIYLRCLNR